MAGVQAATSGCTNVLPAPVIVVSVLLAVAAVAATRTAAAAARMIVIALSCRQSRRCPVFARGQRTGDTCVTKWLPLQPELLARAFQQQAGGEARHEHEEDQDERRRPGLLVLRRIRRLGVR